MRSKENNDGDPDCTEVLEESSRSILMGIISQLSKNMDLHRVTFPTFVLEPRSMLERITDFMSHSHLLVQASKETDPLQRFLGVVRYFLSGWHIKPKGVKKPYNPVLGEIFRCQWKYEDGTSAFYVAEQVSHHPPISTYYYGSPENKVYIQGNIRPKSRFLGNSVASLMEGDSYITFTELHNERYDFTMPNMYARGILFGKMVLELGDSCFVRCRTSDLVCELDFKTKGIFSGQYNSLSGRVKKESTGEVLFEISGQWSGEIFLKMPKASGKSPLFDVKTAVVIPKQVEPESNQKLNESRRMWAKVTKALSQNDLDAATDEKIAIEDKQREDAKYRDEKKIHWTPHYFDMIDKDQYEFKGIKSIDFKSPHAVAQLRSILFDNQASSAQELLQSVDNGTT
ncbi:hypothetical protein EC973_003583 [Apophysomyces ossiformis]|uniref:Oxysterol-binding protein n=1 Tax=Apophysomyces ossiformis TaxID=679940 RepID=A0A8H7BQI2_9FUNG|nr:hypothetical protein EC973_003583 [Apophysomyces ossiformis]